MEVIFACPACRGEYNNEERLPLFLACGHTVCRICIQSALSSEKSLQCPIDGKTDESGDHPINYALLTDPAKAGIRLREKCQFHGFPISVICQTCNMDCCPQCLLEHKTHQLVHVLNPGLLNDLQVKLDQFHDKFLGFLKDLSFKQSNLTREITEVKRHQAIQETELEDYYTKLRKELQTKKAESIQLLRSEFDKKRSQLTEILQEPTKQIQDYTDYLGKLKSCKENFYVNLFVDRAVSSSNLIRKLERLNFNQLPQILSMPLRISCDHTSIYPMHIGNIKLKEQSPLDLLCESYHSHLKELKNRYRTYLDSKSETQLSLEVQSIAFNAYLLSDDEDVWRTLVLMRRSQDILGHDLYSLGKVLLDKVLRKIGIPQLIYYDFSPYTSALKKRITYVQGLIQAMNFVKEQKFKSALELLHCLVIKWDSFQVAENCLEIIFLRMCSEGFYLIKSVRLSHANDIFMLLAQYSKFHMLSDSILYRQILKAFIFYRNRTYVFNDGNNYTIALQKLNECIEELEVPCEFDIRLKFPQECDIEESSLFHWENTTVADQFLDAEKEFRDSLLPWKNALDKLKTRGQILSDLEQQDLEDHLIRN